MSFDFTTLVTDRTQSDVQRVRSVAAKIINGTASEAEIAEWNAATMKGAYNYTDLNRVTAAIEALKAMLEGYGYTVPGYRRIELPRESVGDGTRLPAGHTELKYIESTGTQYVNTAFNPNQDSRVIMDAQMTKDPGTGMAIYFGVRGGGGYFELYKAGSGAKLSFLYNASYSTCFSVDYLLRRTVEINKNTAIVDGVTESLPAGTFQSTLPLFLGADNEGGAAKALTPQKTYSCQIYDNGTLIRDYVPDLTDDGQVGLYDLVEGKFYGNAGTGSFAIGPVVEWEPLPDGDDTEKDPYLWYESDIPTPTLMTDYLANVSAIRSVLEVFTTTPAAPADMGRLTVAEANAIERILADTNTLILNMIAAWFYCGEIYSGEV